MNIVEAFLMRRSKRMLERKKEIDAERQRLHATVQKIVPHLIVLKSEGDYVGYILLGTSLVERQLVTMVKAHIHAMNVLALLSDLSTSKTFAYELNLKIPKNLTSGRALTILEENFGLKENHEKVYTKSKELIDLRNNLSHRLVDQFGGDIELANSELKGVAETDIVENVFNALTGLLNHISTDLATRYKLVEETAKSSTQADQ